MVVCVWLQQTIWAIFACPPWHPHARVTKVNQLDQIRIPELTPVSIPGWMGAHPPLVSMIRFLKFSWFKQGKALEVLALSTEEL